MGRILIKGGVWRNTEDEILKAAVMKYGKNQWARISSLLNRKSAKQCKARWYEWLDPSIKKTEWSRDEEEKLLHLAKLMPCQWRTISAIIGRTPAQCLERYERLLDKASGRPEDDFDDPRKLKPGEIDPAPETKPARPDPVDMDEDEKEMLAEARARLANTQGKKAKRKAREKQLDEARRLASLQKRRELKAAGIETGKFRVRRGQVDYNGEIPFHKLAPKGLYDVQEEKGRTKDFDFTDLTLQKMEGKRRSEEEAEERKKDAKRQKLKKDMDLPGYLTQLNKLNSTPTLNRSKLSLPAPQVGDAELEEFVKLGYAGESAKAAVEGEGTSASKTLLSSYSVVTPNAMTPRVSRTPSGEDSVMREAKNLLALTQIQTPLKGEENTPLRETSFEGMTPKRSAPQTPQSVLHTPRSSLSIPQTPQRQAGNIRAQLREGFLSLPTPQNAFGLLMPTVPDDDIVESRRQREEAALKVPVEERYLEDAKKMVDAELEVLLSQIKFPSKEEFAEIWREKDGDVIFLPSAKAYVSASSVPKGDRAAAQQYRFDTLRLLIEKQGQQAEKLEQKAEIQLKGYQTRNFALRKKVIEVVKELDKARLELSAFQLLTDQERDAIPLRIQELQALVDTQKAREAELQQRYVDLTRRLEATNS